MELLTVDGASAVREARRRTAAVLRRWRCQRERVEEAVLVVSEVVTNALQHGGGVVRVRLLRRRRYVRVEVEDDSPKLPVLMAAPPTAENGRGVYIVRKLAARWGSHLLGRGKLVWAELPCGIDLGVDEGPGAPEPRP